MTDILYRLYTIKSSLSRLGRCLVTLRRNFQFQLTHGMGSANISIDGDRNIQYLLNCSASPWSNFQLTGCKLQRVRKRVRITASNSMMEETEQIKLTIKHL